MIKPFGSALLFGALLSTAPCKAQAYLIQQEFVGESATGSAGGDLVLPFTIQPDGVVKSVWPYFWGFWCDLDMSLQAPSGEKWTQPIGEPWVPTDVLSGLDSQGTWLFEAQELCSGFTSTFDAGFTIVTQRHPDPNLPITGFSEPELQFLDAPILSYLQSRGFEAATVAVVKDRDLVYSRGFGWQDRDRTISIQPSTRMRIATTTVALTARAVQEMVKLGHVALKDKLFDVLGIPALPGHPITDPRWFDVTVEQALSHTAGIPDGAPKPKVLGELLGLGRNATNDETIAYMWSQPLGFDPGSSWSFSHYGFQLLGQSVEKVSGLTEHEVLEELVGFSNGYTSFGITSGAELAPLPGEVWYAGEFFQNHEDDFDYSGPLFEQPYAIDFSWIPGAGGAVASARDLALFANQFWIDSGTRKPASLLAEPFNYGFYVLYGTLPGTTSVLSDAVYADGSSLSWAAIVNERIEGGPNVNQELHSLIQSQLDTISVWPNSPAWLDLGGAASPSSPFVAGEGAVTHLSPVEVGVSGVSAQSVVALVVSAGQTTPVPLGTGTLFAFPYGLLQVLVPNSQGEAGFDFHVPGPYTGPGITIQAASIDVLNGAIDLGNAIYGGFE